MASSSLKLRDILAFLDHTAPFALAEQWDNVGLMVGDPQQDISAIMVGLDPTIEILQEALSHGANLIITHHPLIFHPIKAIRTDQPNGAFLRLAMSNNIAVISCHTNLDVITNGVSAVLARKIGLNSLKPLAVTSKDNPLIGFGQIGTLHTAIDSEIFLELLCQQLKLDVLSICGLLPDKITRVAVCGGSGSDLSVAAFEAKAQVFITGEVKHSTARWAEECKFCIIDAGHFATENVIVEELIISLLAFIEKKKLELPVISTDLQNNPFSYYLKKQ